TAFDLPHAGHIYQVQVLPIQYAGTTAGMAVMQDVTEQRRAQALAELDRAKTAFIANVSHEFRTPLTLLLGPAADALADREAPLPARQRERLEFIERSGLRLYKLVNTLLDFSSIEAGRLQATFVPTDLAALTAELASTFRSAIERAGLRLRVDCQLLTSLRQPVYVDRNMWERIVLNLLSNALKFTFAGEIVVSLRPVPAERTDRAERVELEVRDTGVGIPAEALPHLFERFYRVPGLRGRTHEGTGIGLALVQELVWLHGGTVRASSAGSVGSVGSSFTVGLFTGTAHLPAIYAGNQVHAATEASAAPSALAAKPFVEEALGWLPDRADAYQPAGGAAAVALTPLQTAAHDVLTGASDGLNGHAREARLRRDDAPWGATQGRTERAHILVADDNADMRVYLTHILGERWEVEAVADGAAALAAALARPPDLIVADVMMPGLDGVALLHALRADPATRVIPVLMLSARAGEEATVEGLAAGADDYLTKPFAARELLA
ncbi:MAG TPA: ATP-binding protein, partial [Ktedonobacterales bacterium]|nr:ATP-binding protein [Ktedonobacterales bacterium]